MKKIYLLLVAVATVMTFMACHKEKEVEEKDDGYRCLIPPLEYFYFYIDKEDVSLANFKKELSISLSLFNSLKYSSFSKVDFIFEIVKLSPMSKSLNVQLMTSVEESVSPAKSSFSSI